MALVNQVQKKVMMSKNNIIKFQILTHCYINSITVSNSDLDCLTLLSTIGPMELTHFCYDAAEEHSIFKSQQTVRNCINKCEKNGLVKKDLNNKKVIAIDDSIKVQTNGTILLDYKFLAK
jgi:translation initiation factor 6 (eIF-6)